MKQLCFTLFLLSVVACEKGQDAPALEKIGMEQSTVAMNAGEVRQFGPVFSPANAALPDLVWESSDAKVASVDKNGTVSAHTAGSATITVAANGIYPASCVVLVSTPEITTVSMDGIRKSDFAFAAGKNYLVADAVGDKDQQIVAEALKRQESLTVGLILPQIMEIAASAFEGCSALRTIDLPNAVQIGSYAFSDCKSLVSVLAPEAVYVGNNTFYDTSLASIFLPKARNIGDFAFLSCKSLISADFPSVTLTGRKVFGLCKSLETVHMPSIATVRIGMFENCQSLAEIELPQVVSIEETAFYGCSTLRSVSLPQVVTIGTWGFMYCTFLRSVDLPKAEIIGSGAFYGCSGIGSVNLPVVTSIANGAFNKCTAMNSLGIGSTVAVSVDGDAFTDTSTTNIDLRLGSGEIGNASGNLWQGKEWKSVGAY